MLSLPAMVARRLGILLLMALWGLVVPLAAQVPPRSVEGIQAHDSAYAARLTGETVVQAVRLSTGLSIDGRLDEALYRSPPTVPDLVQSLPAAGPAPSERTETWIAFDDDNVYFAARLWDRAPESEWVANEMRRDAAGIRSNDHFAIYFDTFLDGRNAIGFNITPVGGVSDLQVTNEGNPNYDWNPVVSIRTGRFDGGWTVEGAIPFKAIRYRNQVAPVWGVQLRRLIAHKNEWAHLTHLPLSVTRTGPYGILRVSRYADLVGIEPPPPSRNLQVKPYGIAELKTDRVSAPVVSNELSSDVGLNAKYAITQNLTADLTYNTDFAQVEADEQQVNLTRFSLFFPEKREFFLEGRGIFEFAPWPAGFGRASPLAPTLFYSRRIGLQSNQVVPILGGGRVTGKVGSFDLGVLDIQTRDLASIGAESTNFSVVRVRRDVLARSSMGVLVANRSRSVAGEGGNRTLGIDGSFSLTSDLAMVSWYARTWSPGQASDEDAYEARLSYSSDVWGGQLGHMTVGDGFSPEVGFVRRSGFRQTALQARYSPRPGISWLRQITLQGDVNYVENRRIGFVESRDVSGLLMAVLESGDELSATVNESYENLADDAVISRATIPEGRYSFRDVQVSYLFGPQRLASGLVSFRHGGFFGGHATSVDVTESRLDLVSRLTIEPGVSLNWIDLPALQTRGGEFDQHVGRIRATFSVTPRMFVSALVQYNSGTDTFGTNLRLRWEWSPGSELFVVYSEDRDTDPLTEGWSALASRGVAIKLTRLFWL